MFVCIQILTSCRLPFPADCLIAFSNLLFLKILFKSFRILTVFNGFIFIFLGFMLYHAGHTVKFWTFLCSLKVLWTSLDCTPSVPGGTGVQKYVQKSLWWLWKSYAGGHLHWRGEERVSCVYQHSDTDNTALSQKSIWDLLGRTQLIPGDITNLLICESL